MKIGIKRGYLLPMNSAEISSLTIGTFNPPSVATDLRGTHDISLDAPTLHINAESAPLM